MYNLQNTYSGSEPYIFISYSHKDAQEVLPVIDELQHHDFRIWYDSGVEAGTEWPEYIAENLINCHCVIAFLSSNAADSHNCKREINFAIEEKKELLIVYLEEFSLSPGMRMQLHLLQAIYRNRFGNDKDFLKALLDAKIIQNCKSTATQNTCITLPDSVQKNLSSVYRQSSINDASPQISSILTANHYYEQAMLGDPEAQYKLGNCFYYGDEMQQNYAEAIEWYSKAAQQAHAWAQYSLGYCFFYGKGVPQNYKKATKWYISAAEQGNAPAQYELGKCYYYGYGIRKDYQQALMWYRRAAQQNNANAQYTLGNFFLDKTSLEPQNEEQVLVLVQSMEYYKRAMEQGHLEAKKQYTSIINKSRKTTRKLLSKYGIT